MGDAAVWVSVAAAVVTVVGGGIFTILNRRGGERAKREPTWGELVEENRALREELRQLEERLERRLTAQDEKITTQDRKIFALTRSLETIARHWPPDHPVPDLDADDVEVLADSLPLPFRRRRRAAPT